VLVDLKEQYKKQQLAEVEEDLDIVISTNKTYNQLKKDALKKHIDIDERMLEIFHVMESRVQYLYDKAQKYPEANDKADYILIQYFGKFLDFIKEIRKSKGEPDQIIQHNVTVQAIDHQAAIIQQAIQEAVSELDLETASIVMEKIVSKIEKLKYKESIKLLDEKDEKNIEMLEGTFLLQKKGE